MTENEKLIKEIVDIWYQTKYGHYLKVREKEIEFSDFMLKLYDDVYGIGD